MSSPGRGRDVLDQPGSSGIASFRLPPSSFLVRSSSTSSPLARSLLPPSSSLGRRVRGTSPFSSSSGVNNIVSKRPKALEIEGEAVVVIYFCGAWYDIRAFNTSGELIPRLCFTIDRRGTSLLIYSGIVVVGSTLYMIGGVSNCTTTGDEYFNLDTIEINLDMVTQSNNSFTSDLVRLGPCLNGAKLFPILIVVGCKIYAFARYPNSTESLPNHEFLDTRDGLVQQWTELPELPIPMNAGDVEIVSHTFKKDYDVIILSLTGKKYNGLVMLDLSNHMWTLLAPDTPHSCRGEVVSLHGVNYALKRDQDNVVCCFPGHVAPPVVEEVVGLPPPPADVYWRRSKIVLIGDTLIVARIGCGCMGDPFVTGDPDTNLLIDTFQICEEEKQSKAIDFGRNIYTFEDTGGFKCGLEELHCVSWAQRYAMEK